MECMGLTHPFTFAPLLPCSLMIETIPAHKDFSKQKGDAKYVQLKQVRSDEALVHVHVQVG